MESTRSMVVVLQYVLPPIELLSTDLRSVGSCVPSEE